MNNLNNEKSIQEEIRAVKKQTVKVLGFGFLVILFFLIYWIYFEENLLVESKSPYADKEVIINKVGNWITDSGTIKIYFKENGRTRNTKKIELEIFRESNHKGKYNIVWSVDNHVSIAMVFEKFIQSVDYNFSTNDIEIEKLDKTAAISLIKRN
ncbi:hypothetical protein [Solibacillus sp. FSL K6-1126]|uniref:hypothetical protein n=1 Tax=Solibacillus sp. FSL K6-1126 TaxID=2921463 RepID=UPI0030F9FAEC